MAANINDSGLIAAVICVLGVGSEKFSYVNTNDDLNNFTTPGIYVCAATATAGTLSNCPVSMAFRLEVVPCAGNIFPMQKLYQASKTDPNIYIRYKEGTWGSWKKVQFA